MNEPWLHRVLAVGSLVLALGLLVVGGRRSYSVLPDPSLAASVSPMPSVMPSPPEFDPSDPMRPTPTVIPAPAEASAVRLADWQLVKNATFTGVTRRDGQFFFTYDPEQDQGKRSCPT